MGGVGFPWVPAFPVGARPTAIRCNRFAVKDKEARLPTAKRLHIIAVGRAAHPRRNKAGTPTCGGFQNAHPGKACLLVSAGAGCFPAGLGEHSRPNLLPAHRQLLPSHHAAGALAATALGLSRLLQRPLADSFHALLGLPGLLQRPAQPLPPSILGLLRLLQRAAQFQLPLLHLLRLLSHLALLSLLSVLLPQLPVRPDLCLHSRASHPDGAAASAASTTAIGAGPGRAAIGSSCCNRAIRRCVPRLAWPWPRWDRPPGRHATT